MLVGEFNAIIPCESNWSSGISQLLLIIQYIYKAIVNISDGE